MIFPYIINKAKLLNQNFHSKVHEFHNLVIDKPPSTSWDIYLK